MEESLGGVVVVMFPRRGFEGGVSSAIRLSSEHVRLHYIKASMLASKDVSIS